MALPHESDPAEDELSEAETFDLQTGGAYTGANIEVLEGLNAISDVVPAHLLANIGVVARKP